MKLTFLTLVLISTSLITFGSPEHPEFPEPGDIEKLLPKKLCINLQLEAIELGTKVNKSGQFDMCFELPTIAVDRCWTEAPTASGLPHICSLTPEKVNSLRISGPNYSFRSYTPGLSGYEWGYGMDERYSSSINLKFILRNAFESHLTSLLLTEGPHIGIPLDTLSIPELKDFYHWEISANTYQKYQGSKIVNSLSFGGISPNHPFSRQVTGFGTRGGKDYMLIITFGDGTFK